VNAETLVLFVKPETYNINNPLNHLFKIELDRGKLKFICLNFRHIQDIVDNPQEVF